MIILIYSCVIIIIHIFIKLIQGIGRLHFLEMLTNDNKLFP